MPWKPAPPPLLSDENANELGKWAQQQMEQLAAALEAPDVTAYTVLHVAPAKPREGQIVVADGTDWNPGSGAGQYMYRGGVWVIQRAGPEPNTYGIITDGTTPAPADTAGDTFKLRAATGLAVAVQNDDATHGDNALFSLVLKDLASVAPAIGDKLPFVDISNSDANARTTFQILYDLINGLTTDSTPDLLADFVPTYDVSAAAAKKVLLSKLGAKTFIGTTALSGTDVDITLPTGYSTFECHMRSIVPSGTNTIQVRFSSDAGSTWLNCTYGFHSLFGNTTGAAASIVSIRTIGVSSNFSGILRIHGNSHTNHKYAEGNFTQEASNDTIRGGVKIEASAVLNMLRVRMSGGTFSSGDVDLWGIL